MSSQLLSKLRLGLVPHLRVLNSVSQLNTHEAIAFHDMCNDRDRESVLRHHWESREFIDHYIANNDISANAACWILHNEELTGDEVRAVGDDYWWSPEYVLHPNLPRIRLEFILKHLPVDSLPLLAARRDLTEDDVDTIIARDGRMQTATNALMRRLLPAADDRAYHPVKQETWNRIFDEKVGHIRWVDFLNHPSADPERIRSISQGWIREPRDDALHEALAKCRHISPEQVDWLMEHERCRLHLVLNQNLTEKQLLRIVDEGPMDTVRIIAQRAETPVRVLRYASQYHDGSIAYHAKATLQAIGMD